MLKVYTIIHFIDGKEMKNKWSFGFEHAATEWSPTSDRNIFVRYNYFILNVFKLFIYLFIYLKKSVWAKLTICMKYLLYVENNFLLASFYSDHEKRK